MHLLKNGYLLENIIEDKPYYIIIGMLFLSPFLILEIYAILINFNVIKEFIVKNIIYYLPISDSFFQNYIIGYLFISIFVFSFMIMSEILIEPIYYHIYYKKDNTISFYKLMYLRFFRRLFNTIGIITGYILGKYLYQLIPIINVPKFLYLIFIISAIVIMKRLTDNIYEYIIKNIKVLSV